MADQADSGQVDRLWRAAIDTVPDLMCIRDAEGRFVAVNKTFAQLAARPAGEIVGLRVRDLWPTDTANRMDQHDAEVREQKSSVTYLNRFESHDQSVELLVTTSLLGPPSPGGHLFSVARNLTALRDLGVVLHDREFVYRNLFDRVGDGVFIVDLDTMGFLGFNTAAHESLGYTRDEMSEMNVTDLQADDNDDWVNEKRREIITTGRARFRNRHLAKDGTVRQVEVDNLLSEIGGRPVLVTVVHDVTELQTQAQLLAQAEELAQLGSWELDLASGGLTWSAETHRIFQTDPDSFTPSFEALLEYVHPDDRTLLTEAYQESVDQHTPYSVEHRLLLPDGSVKFVHERGRTIYGPDDQPIRSIGTCQDVTVLHQAREALERVAFEDPLTGLPNRVAAVAELEKLMARSGSASALQIDLVEFQQINGTYGHLFGDGVLQSAGEALREVVAPNSHLSRIGGDEFLIISPDTDRTAALDLARRARAAIQRITTGPMDVPIRLDARVGVGVGSDGTASALLQQADIALHLARESDACQVYSSDMSESMRQQITVLSRFDQALADDELFLEYQAQVNAEGELVGAEALVRWRTADGTTLPPGSFIPVIEGTPLVEKLGVWVVDRAARQLAEWRSRRLAIPAVSVNLSAQHFLTEEGISPALLETLDRHGLARDDIEVEITESVVMPMSGQIPPDVTRLAEAGVPIAIDDFGTGYSSMSMLYRLPLRRLKIDRSLISGLPDESGAAAIVEATLALAGALDLECLAEGVETAAELQWLQAAGCTIYQGFLFDRPRPPEVFAERWLKSPRSGSVQP